MVKKIISICTLIGMILTVYLYVDRNYAKASDFAQLEQRLDYKIAQDQYQQIQNRIWMLEDRYQNGQEMPLSVREEIRKLKEELDLFKTKLNVLEQRN